MAPQATVRHAQRQDAPSILGLIKALALYEKEPDAVEATVETIQNTIAFAPPPDASANDADAIPDTQPITPQRPSRCLLIFGPESGTTPVGMALYFYNYSTWRSRPGIYLEDLFVQPSARGNGYGKRLLVELARQVVAMGGGRLDWSVLRWNEPSIRFYEAIGAKAMDDWVGMRVEGPGLEKLARLLD